jgi:hypothetical protein
MHNSSFSSSVISVRKQNTKYIFLYVFLWETSMKMKNFAFLEKVSFEENLNFHHRVELNSTYHINILRVSSLFTLLILLSFYTLLCHDVKKMEIEGSNEMENRKVFSFFFFEQHDVRKKKKMKYLHFVIQFRRQNNLVCEFWVVFPASSNSMI